MAKWLITGWAVWLAWVVLIFLGLSPLPVLLYELLTIPLVFVSGAKFNQWVHHRRQQEKK